MLMNYDGKLWRVSDRLKFQVDLLRSRHCSRRNTCSYRDLLLHFEVCYCRFCVKLLNSSTVVVSQTSVLLSPLRHPIREMRIVPQTPLVTTYGAWTIAGATLMYPVLFGITIIQAWGRSNLLQLSES